jgi:hypothetical protein
MQLGAAAGTVIDPLYVGGGGYCIGINIHPDGTMLTNVDIFGSYVGSTAIGTIWQQTCTYSGAPSVYTSTPTPYLEGGAWTAAIDPSNSSIMWMVYALYQGANLTALWKSIDKGVTWQITAMPLFTASSSDGNRYLVGQRLAIDPNNGNIVYCSTQTQLWATTDGGATFNRVTSGTLPAASNPGFVAMAFDPTTANRLIVGCTGSGSYVSTNSNLGGSSTWTQISGSITNPAKGKFGSDGNYYQNASSWGTSFYRVDSSNTLHTTTPTAAGISEFAIDPNNPARAVLIQFGIVSFGGPVNGSATWSGPGANPWSIVAPDAPWQAEITSNPSPKSDAEVQFDPFKTTSATSVTIGTGTKTWTDVSLGLNLVVGDLVRVTNTGTPANYMLGLVTAYSSGNFSISVLTNNPGGYLGANTGGSGTFSAWTITKDRLWISSGFGVFWTDGLYAQASNLTISSGTYNSGTGAVSLTLTGSAASGFGQGTGLALSSLTGTGSFAALQAALGVGFYTNTFNASSVSGTTVNFTGPTGLGSVTITGGTLHQVYNWNSMNVGIDSLVARQVIWPANNVPMLCSADVPVWQVPNNPFGASVGLSNFGPNANAPVVEGQFIDWASNVPTFIVETEGQVISGTLFQGSNSSSGALGSWTSFPVSPGNGTVIAAADANNFVWASASSIKFTTDGGNTWSAVTGASIPSTGWSNSLGANPNFQSICADRVNIGTFYAYNFAGNVYKIISGTATLQFTGKLDPSNSTYAFIIKAVPTQGGHIFWTGGTADDAAGLYSSLANVTSFIPSRSSYPFQFSSNAGVTWTALANVANVLCFGFGAAAAGASYPAIFIAGWVNGIYGLWRCDNFNPSSLGSETWIKIGIFARNWIDCPRTMEGDMSQWGRFIIGHNGSGFSIGESPTQPNAWP